MSHSSATIAAGARRAAALALVCLLLAAASPALAARRAAPADRFFPKRDLMQVGVYYYPEHWPREQWERDFANMEKMGFSFVHMAEFSWAFLEPSDGRFDFAWLDEAVRLAAAHNLRVVLCTPTPCPPAWLSEAHPETFLVGADGRRREHGSRGNNALADPTYLRYAERVIDALGKHYGRNPAVWGWQLDNEPIGQPDYSPSAQAAFRTWLAERYKTVETLNREWGTAFWSLRYDSFDQVRPPNPTFLYGVNPHAVLDFRRFTADQTARFLDWQTGILRRSTAPEQWITTNYIANIGLADGRRTHDLDFASFTLYPVGGGGGVGEDGFRIGWQDGMTFGGPFYRSVGGVTGVMELQPGQVNWAQVNPQPMPGVVRMWLWHAFGVGAAFACTYRFRQPLYGSEQYHYGIVGPDGVTPSPGGREYSQVTREMRTLREKYDPTAKQPAALAARRAAILWSHENLWNIDNQKQHSSWDTWSHMFRYMQSLESLGAPVAFPMEGDDLAQYPVVVAPAYQLIDRDLVAKWTRYVEQGGHLVLTCRTGQKQRNGQLWEAKWAEPIYALVGAEIPMFDLIPSDRSGKVSMGGAAYDWNVWGDVLEPAAGTEALATYADQFYAGKAAVTHRKLGKGTVTYVGVHTKDGRLEREVLREVYRRAGVATEDYPEGVHVNWRDGFWVAVNYSSRPVDIPVPSGAEIIFGERRLAPASALVWRESASRTSRTGTNVVRGSS
jgi:beta-galactosidase